MTILEMTRKASSENADKGNDPVMQELPQVYYAALRIRERLPQHVEIDDLVSAGVIGLLEATRSFDAAKNVQFRTFAQFRIRGAILDSLRETDWGSRRLRRHAREIAEASARLQSRLGRHPTESEIAQELELKPEQLRKLLAQIDALQIVEQQVSVSSDPSESFDLVESAPSLNDPSPFDSCLEGERKRYLTEAVSQLSEREQLLLSLYYREELTMKEISQVLGLSLSRVSQIHEAAKSKLRAALRHLRDKPIPQARRSEAHLEPHEAIDSIAFVPSQSAKHVLSSHLA